MISRRRAKCQLCWDLPRWMKLWTPPSRMWIYHQPMKVHQRLMFLRLCSGETVSRIGLLQAVQCAIRMGCLHTYATLSLHKGCQFCARKCRPQASPVKLWSEDKVVYVFIQVTQCLVLVWGQSVLKSIKMADDIVKKYGQCDIFLMQISSQEKA